MMSTTQDGVPGLNARREERASASTGTRRLALTACSTIADEAWAVRALQYGKSLLGRAAVVAALASQSGCSREVIWLANPAAGVSGLTFEFGRRRGYPEPTRVAVLMVNECDSGQSNTAAWSIDGGRGTPVASIRYGQVPPGFHATMPAQRLRPGCYQAWTLEGDGSVFFEVGPDSATVREIRPPQSHPGR